ncbi:MAG: Hpt domain-containing protein [Chromatiales bacterium]|nr:Hpt domain-containing protein [Chromatiales bacterium]
MHSTKDYSTLKWIRGELDLALTTSRRSLEAFAEDDEQALIDDCIANLHQVHGTLQMVQIYGAAMLAEEMELVSIALKEERVKQQEEAAEALMLAIIQLSDYLEKLEGGARDLPILLLPLLNELRATREAPLLSEVGFFSPELDRQLQEEEASGVANAELPQFLRKNRLRYHRGLLDWYRDTDTKGGLEAIADFFQQVADKAGTEAVKRLFKSGHALAVGLMEGSVDSGFATKQLVGRIDRYIKGVMTGDETSLDSEGANDYLKNLLYYIACAKSDNPAIQEIQRTYRLSDVVLDEAALSKERNALHAPGRELFDSLRTAIGEDLTSIKDGLDLFIRTQSDDLNQLGELEQPMRKLADTLGMVGQGGLRNRLKRQAETISKAVLQGEALNDQALMSMASDILFIETSLKNLSEPRHAYVMESVGEDSESTLPEGEFERLVDSVMHEATLDMTRSKDAVISYIEAPEVDSNLLHVPHKFKTIAGAFSILKLSEPAGLLEQLASYVETRLIATDDVPDNDELNAFADAVTSIEYFMEAIVEGRGVQNDILQVTREAMEQLHLGPADKPGEEDTLEQASPEAAPEPTEEAAEAQEPVVETPVAEPAPAPAPTASADKPPLEDIDPEILDIFIEEAREELGVIQEYLPRWLNDRDDQNALITFRRSFHTLKGSGRLVGALTIGELAWSVENMLNRVIDGTVEASPAVVQVLNDCVAVLPELIDCQERGEQAQVDLQPIMDRAFSLTDPNFVVDETVSTVTTDVAVEESSAEEEVVVEPAVSMDPVLLEIFQAESQGHIDTLRRFLKDCQASELNCAVDSRLVRAWHTLHGSAKMSEVDSIAAISAANEKYINLLSDQNIHADEAIIALLERGVGGIEAILACINEPGSVLPDWEAIVRDVEAACTVLQEQRADAPVDADSVSESLLAEAVPVVEEELVEVEAADEFDADSQLALAQDKVGEIVSEIEMPVVELLSEELSPDELPQADLVEEVPDGTSEIAEEVEPVSAVDDDSEPEEITLAEPPLEETPVVDLIIDEVSSAEESSEQEIDSVEELLEEEITDQDESEPPDDTSEIAEEVEPVSAVDDDSEPEEITLAEPPLEETPVVDLIIDEIPNAEESSEQETDSASEEPEEEITDQDESEPPLVAAEPSEEEPSEAPVALTDLEESEQVDALEIAEEQTEAGDDAAESGDQDQAESAQDDQPLITPSLEAPLAASVEMAEVDGDPELIEIFLEEARELLESIENSYQQWSANPSSSEPVAELERTLHTLKGGARLAGAIPVGDLSHAFESLLTDVDNQRREATPQVIELAQVVIDRLAEQIEDLSAGPQVRMADDLVRRLEGKDDEPPVAAESVEADQSEAVEPEETAEPEPVAETPESDAPAQPEASESEVEPAEQEPEVANDEVSAPAEPIAFSGDRVKTTAAPTTPRPNREQVRVRSELLDRLVNHAGEVSIYRARVEQQNTALGFNLDELEQTVDRLRGQLRQLEIETEAQILFRYDQDKEEQDELDEEFDPLELDRFSTIQQVSRSLMETVNDLNNIYQYLDELQKETDTLLLQQSRIANDLQDGLMRTRMVPFSQLVPRLHRIVRQTCNPMGKQARLEIRGAESQLDRRILERMIGPLEHLLRNSVSHGIESPEQRRQSGKDLEGRITLDVRREGTDILVTVADDGAGINTDAIKERAIANGLLDPGADVTDNDILQFVFEHGFSTAAEVTQIAGRGVGLGVVVSEVKQLGGALDVASEVNQGTRFMVRLPLTLAIADALLVELGEEIYAIPHTSILGVVRVSYAELKACYEGEQAAYNYAGQDYQVRYLGALLNVSQLDLSSQRKWYPMLLVRAGDHHVALQIDGIIGNRQVVVKSVGPQISTVRYISGGTILADGRVALLLDVAALVRLDIAHTAAPAEDVGVDEGEQIGYGRTVMVVDDSITVRKVTGRLLERNGMNVITAKDGVDALATLQEHRPDVMLLDIEMPRMDGYELARHLQNSEELNGIPVIMITSRTGEKHRNRAMELGVKRYLGKPYQESDLLDNIYSVIQESAS